MADTAPDVRLPPLIIEKGMGGFTIAFFGSSKSGKTTLMMALYKKMFDRARYISTLFSVNSQIEAYKDTKYLLRSSQFGPEEARYIRSQKFVNTGTNNKYNFMILLDDFIDIRHSAVFNNLILTYRNSNISTMICLQYVRLLSKQARGNVNNIMFFSSNSEEARTELIKVYLGSLFRRMGIVREGWDDAYQYYTRDHQYLYLHVASSTLWSSRTQEYLLQ
jgi:molybdopterin-guanine dinucleotide biosynthesis protein